MTRQYHNGIWDNTSVFVFGSNLAGIHGSVFVFGSNLAGIHGAGDAKYAMKNCGAIFGKGYGLQGNSYALPTKDECIVTLPLLHISSYIKSFIHCAEWSKKTFFVTAIGTGLAGYKHSQIAPMFKDAPANCVFPTEWKEYLEEV